MASSRILVYLCAAFLGGIALSSLFLLPEIFVYGVFVLGLILISVLWGSSKKAVIVGICLIVFALGVYRHQMFERPKDALEYYNVQNSDSENNKSSFSLPYNYDRSYKVMKMVDTFKNGLRESLDSSLSPPQSSILGAMMLGEKERLSYELKEKLNRSGTRHITAISGMHVMILAQILIGLGLILGLWRGQAFYFALAAIILFIIMVGAPPSAIRAGIMGGTVLFAQKVGRLSQAQRLLVIAATLMLAVNPLLLKFDVGFQLSFLATLGIAKLSPWFLEKFSRIPKILQLRQVAAMSFPAVIFTAPILASNFGQVSLVSIFTNILIVPLLGLVLGLGFFAGTLGMISQPLGQIFFWPNWMFLTYIDKIIDWSAQVPFAAVQIEVFPWYLTALYFALLWWGIKYFRLDK